MAVKREDMDCGILDGVVRDLPRARKKGLADGRSFILA